MRRKRQFPVWVGLAAALGAGFYLAKSGANPLQQPRPLPMVLRQVQALGELHTARYSYENVFEHQSSLAPDGWLASLPGAAEVSRASTRNTALMSIQGRVEAGVDLAKSRQEIRSPGRVTLILPHAQVYEPQVDAQVHDVHRGVFWRDDNIGLDAVSDAKARLRSAARDQGIIADAERNAIRQVRDILPAGDRDRVEIVVG